MEWIKEHIIEVLMLAIGALGAWFTLKSRVDHANESLRKITRTLEDQDDLLNKINTNVSTLKTSHDALTTRIDTLEANFQDEIKRLRDDRHELAVIIGNLQGGVHSLEKVVGYALGKNQAKGE